MLLTLCRARLITRITGNGHAVWQVLRLTLQSFHMRMGVPDTTNPIGIDIGASIHDEQLIEVTKELALPTALVRLYVSFHCVVIADSNRVGLDETCAASHV
jgi:3-deoxy-D-arabino-heptulosonate 7-phosphate (DAHP) synthase class II